MTATGSEGRAEAVWREVTAAAPPAAAPWLAGAWPTEGEGLSPRLRAAFAAARRHLGDAPLPAEAAARLAALGLPAAARRPLHLLGRVALLLRAVERTAPAEAADLVLALFRRSDTLEQCAILCALPLLPDPGRFVATALQATRGYVREVFETLAVENPYPAAHLDDGGFRQLVLKALFIGVPLAGIVGLKQRTDDELRRMAADFGRERQAAGRPVPADIALLLAPA